MISVILPTFNEIDSGYLGPIMSRLPRLSQAEILAVDGGSTDGTVEFIDRHGVEVLSLPGSSRAARMNLGIEQSQGEMLLLHHPRRHAGRAHARRHETCTKKNKIDLL